LLRDVGTAFLGNLLALERVFSFCHARMPRRSFINGVPDPAADRSVIASIAIILL
jgi:hypothetical protein